MGANGWMERLYKSNNGGIRFNYENNVLAVYFDLPDNALMLDPS